MTGASRVCAFAALSALSGTATGQAIALKQAQICGPDRLVDKELLVQALLDAAQASRKTEDWAVRNPQGFEDLNPRQRMIADEDLCVRDGKPLPRCGDKDAEKLAAARQALTFMLRNQTPAYRNPSGLVEARRFFASGPARLQCVSDTLGQPVEMAGAVPRKFELKVPVRVRGNADGLHFSRAEEAQFKPQDKAAISFASDRIKNKRTEKFSAAVGYPFPITDRDGRTAELVPYVAISRDIAEVEDSKTVNADVWRAGAVFDYIVTARRMTHVLVARPEYAFNDKDNSKLGTLNLTYVPVINTVLNDYIRLVPEDDQFISVQPMLDLRVVAGHFLEQGTRTGDDSRDFFRVGGQVGLSFTSDRFGFPADLTLTELYLPSLSGGRKDLSYFKAVLALGLHKDRLFGVDVSYARGRRDDLLDKERSWTIGFGVKF